MSWTTYTPSSTSKLFYVSGISGDDAAAGAVNGGLGFYRAGDTAIGPDPTNPVGPIIPYATAKAAIEGITGTGITGTRQNGGCDDWMLFARGETFHEIESGQTGHFIGYGPKRTSSPFPLDMAGITYDRPIVITSWGNTGAERPTFSGRNVNVGLDHIRWVSVRFGFDGGRASFNGYSTDTRFYFRNVLFEDCYFTKSVSPSNVIPWTDIEFYRCQMVDGSNFFISSVIPNDFIPFESSLKVRECVFDRNGYDEDPNDATTWTALTTSGSGVTTAGQGYQPSRNDKKRHIYASKVGKDFFLQGNLFSRGCGGGSVQMRVGGACERNVFLMEHHALEMGHNESGKKNAAKHNGIAKQNLHLHDDIFQPPGGWGQGFTITGYTGDFVFDDNIVAHFHRHGNARGSFEVRGRQGNSELPPSRLGLAIIVNNNVFQQYGTQGFEINSSAGYPPGQTQGINSLFFENNNISSLPLITLFDRKSNSNIMDTRGYESPIREGIWVGTLGASFGNNYHGATANFGANNWKPFYELTFEEHQAQGYDTYTSFTGDFDGFKDLVGWITPERDIVSYMVSIDSGYTADMDVTVDYGVLGATQTTPQKIYDILLGDSTDPNRILWAETTTKRFHAAVTFIYRARNNRKYNWDENYTANSLNNYIREGFNRTAIPANEYLITNVDDTVREYVERWQSYVQDLDDKHFTQIQAGFTGPEILGSVPPQGTTSNGFYANAGSLIGFQKPFKFLFDRLGDGTMGASLINSGFIEYQPVYQLADPTGAEGGTIDSAGVVDWMQTNLGSTFPNGTYVMLNFESPYFDIIQNGDTGGIAYTQTINEMVDLVQAVKAAYPNSKVGYNGIPILKYWINNKGWNSLSNEDREYHLAEALDRNYDIMEAVDWLIPSAYDRYDSNILPDNADRSANEYLWRYFNVELCKRYKETSGSSAEIIPAVSGMFWKVGAVEYNKKKISSDEFIRDQIRGIMGIESGYGVTAGTNTVRRCDGLAFWHSYPFWIKQATSSLPQHTGSNQNETRYAFQQDYFDGITPDWEGYA